MRYELGFIGAGNMAEAIARVAIDKQVLSATQMIASDPMDQRRHVFASLNIPVTTDNSEVMGQAQHILLAVKPQTLPALGQTLGAVDPQRQVVMSIMAGVRTQRIVDLASKPVRIVRIMPNTPLLVGCGMSGIAMGQFAQSGDESLAVKLFGAAGEAILVNEADLDAITAVSGSGPAYVFYLAEAMQRAASELGLSQHAALLVGQTILGAAQLIRQSDDAPEELRRKVTSPGGTTEAALRHLDGNKTTDVFINAIKAAQKRSIELGG